MTTNLIPNNSFALKGKVINKITTTVYAKSIKLVLNLRQQQEILDLWLNSDSKKYYSNINSAYDFFLLKLVSSEIERKQCKTLSEIMTMLGFDFVQNKKTFKVTHFNGELDTIKPLFQLITHIISPNNYMSLVDEKQRIIGWFFNNNTIYHYDSLEKLQQLQGPFLLNKRLNKELNKKEKSSLKIKYSESF